MFQKRNFYPISDSLNDLGVEIRYRGGSCQKLFGEIQKSKINSSPKNFEVADRDVQTELRNEKFKNAKMIGKIRISRSPIEQKDDLKERIEKGLPPAYSSPDSNSEIRFKV